MADLTKAQLLERLEEANKLIEEQQVQIEAHETKLGELQAKGAGWLIETENPGYAGVSYGIQFLRGQAFVGKNQKVPAVAITPTKETYFEKHNIPEAERRAIREREAISEAERVVGIFEHDLGYAVTYFDGSEEAEKKMARMLDSRVKEYAKAVEMAQAREKAENIVAPHYMG